MEGGGDEGVERLVDSKDMQQQSKAFDKLTDRVEDRQLDSTRVQEVLSYKSSSSSPLPLLLNFSSVDFFYISRRTILTVCAAAVEEKPYKLECLLEHIVFLFSFSDCYLRELWCFILGYGIDCCIRGS